MNWLQPKKKIKQKNKQTKTTNQNEKIIKEHEQHILTASQIHYTSLLGLLWPILIQYRTKERTLLLWRWSQFLWNNLAHVWSTRATTEFRTTQGQHMQIRQRLLQRKTDNSKSFCYLMIWKWVALYSEVKLINALCFWISLDRRFWRRVNSNQICAIGSKILRSFSRKMTSRWYVTA